MSEVQVIIQGGAVGLAFVSLCIIGYAMKVLVNHIPHLAASMDKIALSIEAFAAEIRHTEELHHGK